MITHIVFTLWLHDDASEQDVERHFCMKHAVMRCYNGYNVEARLVPTEPELCYDCGNE